MRDLKWSNFVIAINSGLERKLRKLQECVTASDHSMNPFKLDLFKFKSLARLGNNSCASSKYTDQDDGGKLQVGLQVQCKNVNLHHKSCLRNRPYLREIWPARGSRASRELLHLQAQHKPMRRFRQTERQTQHHLILLMRWDMTKGYQQLHAHWMLIVIICMSSTSLMFTFHRQLNLHRASQWQSARARPDFGKHGHTKRETRGCKHKGMMGLRVVESNGEVATGQWTWWWWCNSTNYLTSSRV